MKVDNRVYRRLRSVEDTDYETILAAQWNKQLRPGLTIARQVKSWIEVVVRCGADQSSIAKY
jgi:hypothetical protein